MQAYLLVGAGGALGAMARYGFYSVTGHFWPSSFPYATMLINVIGSLAMGVLVGLLAKTLPAWQNEARLFVAVGVLGGFTTFSAFSLDAITLIERGQWGQAILYALASVIVSIVALFLGLLLMRLAA
ncbi:MAG: fluoride efflux transporter CrcB [Devosia sp.]